VEGDKRVQSFGIDFSQPGVLLLALSVLAWLCVIIPYGIYYLSVYRQTNRVTQYLTKLTALQQRTEALPKISIIVSTYNEATVIQRKIQNLASLAYPLDQLEVLVIDDCSQDATGTLAAQALTQYHLQGRVHRTASRLGLNQSLNYAFRLAQHPYICVTDADVTLAPDALTNAITVLTHFEGAGGVTGRIVPVHANSGMAPSCESDYRNYYDRAMVTESAIHSAFPGNGPLIMFQAAPNTAIPVEYGATDANIVMNVIKRGKRLLYVPNAVIYEPVPETLGQQRLQKVRRATRLIQAFLHNRDVFLNSAYSRFGQLLFPVKFLIHVICPILLILGTLLFLPFIFLYANAIVQWVVMGLGGLAVLGLIASPSLRGFVLSFLMHQLYLVLGILSLPRQGRTWQIIDRRPPIDQPVSARESPMV
jgi:cellulose synthase/poly-beta-1,6-N-acetylglucosamine synthase-like glycosyltransferase